MGKASQVAQELRNRRSWFARGITTHLANPVMFGKSIKIENGEHQGFVKCVSIRKIFELESFIEIWVESLPVDFGFKFFYPLGVGQKEDLKQNVIRLRSEVFSLGRFWLEVEMNVGPK